jgi:hypothetical protein
MCQVFSNTTRKEFVKHEAQLHQLHKQRRENLGQTSKSSQPLGVQFSTAEAKARYEAEQVVANAEREQHAKAAAERLGVTWEQAAHYATALARWAAAGFPTRPDEEVERIFRECCQPCDQHVDGRCKKCGCCVSAKGMAIRNKLKMATEKCPLGKW